MRGDAFFKSDGTDFVGLAVIVATHKGAECDLKRHRSARREFFAQKNDLLTLSEALHNLPLHKIFRK
jgi:hypothetical protein